MPKRSPQQKAIDNELREFKECLMEGHELLTPWDKLPLDQFDESEGEDWDRDTKRLFEVSGLDPKRIGHWRLLTGLLASKHFEQQHNDGKEPNQCDAENLGFWVRNQESLIEEACQIARQMAEPARSDEQVAKKLRERPFLLYPAPRRNGDNRRSIETVRKQMKRAIRALKARYECGEFDEDSERKSYVEEQLRLFKFHSE